MLSKGNTSRSTLTVTQLNAIDCLAGGKTDGETAEAVGVTRQTVNGWRNHHPEFIATLNARRLEIWRAAEDRLPAILSHAFNTLEAAMTGDSPDWRAAVRIIELSGLSSRRQRGSKGAPPHIGPIDPLAVVDAEVRRRRAGDFLQEFEDAVTEEERQTVLDEWRSSSPE